MRVDAARGVQERRHAGVGGPDEFLAGDAFGRALLAFGEEVEEEAVEGAGGARVLDWDAVGGQGRFEHVAAFAVEVCYRCGAGVIGVCQNRRHS